MSPTLLSQQENISLSERQRKAAQSLDSAGFSARQASGVMLKLSDDRGHNLLLPEELVSVIMAVLTAAAEGRTISVGVLPKEVTTSTAARMMGVSRPTVVKMIKDGKLTARMVGTHRRLLTEDVQRVMADRLATQRETVLAMMEMADNVQDYS